ncbi:MAG TPA: phage tail tape measure protein [Polyangia bacterium]|nr:phage tail tape measure protein [Polyangia bacterium]
MSEHKLAILVTAVGAAKAAKQLNGVDQSISNIGARSGQGLRTAGRNLAKIGVAAGVVAVGIGVAATKAAIDWEDAFAGVAKTVDEGELKASGMSLEALGESIRAMSREMPNSAIELAGIAEAAGALGVKASDIESFTRQVAILASTTDISAEDAATGLGQLTNVIGLTGDEYDNFAATLVDLGNKGASTESQILEIAKRSGAAAKLIGLGKDESVGWAAAAANLGMESELAGTSLQRMFLKLMPAFTKGGKTLQDVTGKTAAQLKKSFDKDAGGAIQDLLTDLGKMPKDARLAAVTKLFGKGTGLQRMVLGLADSMDKNLAPSLDTASKAWKESTAAQVEYEKRAATVKSAIAILKNNVIDMAVTLGEGVAPAIGRAATKLKEFLQIPENRTAIKKIGEDVGKLIDGINWGQLLGYVKDFMGALDKAGKFVGVLWDAFMAMPSEVKGTLLALAGLNKLSGGAVSGIVGELGKGLIKGVLGMTAGVVNIKAGVVNGGGGGIGGKLGSAGAGAAGAGGSGAAAAAGGFLAPGLAPLIAMAAAPLIMTHLIPKLAAMQPGFVPEAGVGKGSETNTTQLLKRWEQSYMSPSLRALQKTDANTSATTSKVADMDRGSYNRSRSEMVEARSASNAVKAKLAGVQLAAQRTAAAIKEKNWNLRVNVPVTVSTRVSVRDNRVAVVTAGRYAGKSVPI